MSVAVFGKLAEAAETTSRYGVKAVRVHGAWNAAETRTCRLQGRHAHTVVRDRRNTTVGGAVALTLAKVCDALTRGRSEKASVCGSAIDCRDRCRRGERREQAAPRSITGAGRDTGKSQVRAGEDLPCTKRRAVDRTMGVRDASVTAACAIDGKGGALPSRAVAGVATVRARIEPKPSALNAGAGVTNGKS